METTPQFVKKPSPLRGAVIGVASLVAVALIGFGVVKLSARLPPGRPAPSRRLRHPKLES